MGVTLSRRLLVVAAGAVMTTAALLWLGHGGASLSQVRHWSSLLSWPVAGMVLGLVPAVLANWLLEKRRLTRLGGLSCDLEMVIRNGGKVPRVRVEDGPGDEAVARLASDINKALSLVSEGARRSREEFLANMSHELRTPMNAIIGMTDLCLMTEMTPQQQEYLGMVERSARHLLGLIDNVLDFACMEKGPLDLLEEDFDLARTLFEAIQAKHGQASAKGLLVSLSMTASVPCLLHGDVERLRQVVMNLLDNSVRFTEAGKVELSVTAPAGGSERTESNRTMDLHFCVRDTGCGIPREKQEIIFQSFTQADGSYARGHEGLGLGLTVAKSLVERMGGRIWVDSRPGEGASFHFVLPFEVLEEPARELAGSPSRTMGVDRLAIGNDFRGLMAA